MEKDSPVHPVLTVAEMRAVDAAAIAGDDTVGLRYMHRAGRGLFHAVRELIPDPGAGEIAIICGKGNNGGDGYAVGKLLVEEGYRTMCYSLVPTTELGGSCQLAYQEFVSCRGNVLVLDDPADFPHPSRFRLIIDAMLGTGLAGNPRGIVAAVIDMVNASGVPVLAADTPSGLNNDTGIPGSPCIRAAITVAMGFSKPGLYFHPGRELAGRLAIEELGYPENIVADVSSRLFRLTRESLRKLLPLRKPWGSKFDHGLALIVGGAPGMAGSVTLAANAAMRTGCGMVHCAIPESIADILSVKLTEPVLHALPAERGTIGGSGAADDICALAASMQALCIGPGLSHEPAAVALVRDVVGRCALPTVLDADGLNAFKGAPELLEQHAGPLVLTPHAGEWERLFGALPAQPPDRIGRMRETARRIHATLLLKGSPTLVVAPDGTAVILPYGNSALAKAGSGDVLSGIITSLCAQGVPVTDAAILGAYLHGTAGEIAAMRLTEYSVCAGEVTEQIGAAIRTLL
jgi:NAD(P)H-hydrate epimerase